MLTETHNFSNQHIGAIKNNRDNISQQYNVEIKITGKRFGLYQEVQITGFSKDIRSSLSALNLVAEQADNDFRDYKERVRRRRKSNKVSPSRQPIQVESKPKTCVNPFAILQIDDSDDEDQTGDTCGKAKNDSSKSVLKDYEDSSSSNSGEDFEEISEMKLCWADM